MALEYHRQAEELMARADAATARNDRGEAARLWREAATLELRAFTEVSPTLRRTRGILAVGVVALLIRAGDRDAAQDACIRLLARDDLPEAARGQLFELLDQVRHESDGAAIDTDSSAFEWVLRGPGIGRGSAPGGALIAFLEHVQKYSFRVVEYAWNMPLRIKGAPEARITDSFRFRVSAPTAGSFRLRTAITESPVQTEMLSTTSVAEPRDVSQLFADILDSSVARNPADSDPDSEGLAYLVSDPEYRTTFLRLARLIVPDGKDIDEVEVHRGASESTILTTADRRRIDTALSRGRTAVTDATERAGVLRALDLDSRSIELSSPAGRLRCVASKEALVLEDIIGPLVNRHVRVVGRGQGRSFVFSDIVEDDQQ